MGILNKPEDKLQQPHMASCVVVTQNEMKFNSQVVYEMRQVKNHPDDCSHTSVSWRITWKTWLKDRFPSAQPPRLILHLSLLLSS